MGDIVVLSDYVNCIEREEFAPYIKPASAWGEGWARVQMLEGLRRAAWWRYKIAVAVHGHNSVEVTQARRYRVVAERAWEAEAIKQLFIAAPAVRFLRWKEKFAKCRRNPEVNAALERDRAAHAVQIAGRQKAIATLRARRALP